MPGFQYGSDTKSITKLTGARNQVKTPLPAKYRTKSGPLIGRFRSTSASPHATNARNNFGMKYSATSGGTVRLIVFFVNLTSGELFGRAAETVDMVRCNFLPAPRGRGSMEVKIKERSNASPARQTVLADRGK